jgi:hypothetical protein
MVFRYMDSLRNRSWRQCMFLTASEMYHEEFRKAEHCSLNNDLFLQKPISTNDLVMEVNKKINSTR